MEPLIGCVGTLFGLLIMALFFALCWLVLTHFKVAVDEHIDLLGFASIGFLVLFYAAIIKVQDFRADMAWRKKQRLIAEENEKANKS